VSASAPGRRLSGRSSCSPKRSGMASGAAFAVSACTWCKSVTEEYSRFGSLRPRAKKLAKEAEKEAARKEQEAAERAKRAAEREATRVPRLGPQK